MIVDVNVHLSHWPTRRLPFDETPPLVAKLRENGITQAWAGSFDGLLHRDIAAVNLRLAEQCKTHGSDLLVPFGSINPRLPDWREDVRRCAEEHHMLGVRLHPNYHGYKLDEPVFGELLDVCEQQKLIVQLVAQMEDERTQHPLLRVEPVDLSPLAKMLGNRSTLKLIVVNGLRSMREDDLSRLAAAGQVWFEIAMLEGIGGISRLLQHVPLDQILFGSYFPFFYLESALLKLRESQLANFQLEAIRHKTVQQVLST